MKKLIKLSIYALSVLFVSLGFTACGGDEPTTLEFATKAITLKIGETQKLDLTVEPSSAKVTFTSSDDAIATVDGEGTVTAVAEGAAMITAKSGNMTATCGVTVTAEGSIGSGSYTSADAILFGNEGDGIDHALIRLLPEGVTGGNNDGSIAGNGTYIQFYLLFNETANITAGTYPVEAFEGQFNAGTAVAGTNGTYGPIGCAVLTVANGQVADYNLINGGTVTVAGSGNNWTINANVTCADGTEASASYNGNISFIDQKPNPDDAYELEDPTVVTENFTFTSASATKYAAENGVHFVSFELESATNTLAAGLFIAEGATSLVGTYQVSESGAAGTCLASTGGDEAGNVYYTFLGTLVDGALNAPIWFITGGSITITAEGATCNLTSYFGSTLTATYTGAINMTDAPTSAPQRAAANKMPVKPSYRMF